jgi:hypothetical protein
MGSRHSNPRLAATSSQACCREHIPETTPSPVLNRQADQLACDQCGKRFTPRQHTGGSMQRFCSRGCRLDWHKDRQRAQRIGSYAGQLKVPATLQAEPSEAQRSEPAVGQLHPWEIGGLDIAGCDCTEFVLALRQGEVAGASIQTWPMEVRLLMDRHVGRWIDENIKTCTVRAMTFAAPTYDGIESCVVILHYTSKE